MAARTKTVAFVLDTQIRALSKLRDMVLAAGEVDPETAKTIAALSRGILVAVETQMEVERFDGVEHADVEFSQDELGRLLALVGEQESAEEPVA